MAPQIVDLAASLLLSFRLHGAGPPHSCCHLRRDYHRHVLLPALLGGLPLVSLKEVGQGEEEGGVEGGGGRRQEVAVWMQEE